MNVGSPMDLDTPMSTPGPSTAAGTRMSTRPRMPSLAGREPQTLAEAAMAKSVPSTPLDYNYSERTTRSKTAKPKLTAKVKLKLGDKATQGIGNSFLGPYDRELDTEDEDDQDLVFEEQFVLKMPEGEDCEKLRTMVQTRAVTSDVWFKFKDSRRGQFHIGNNTYAAKLVDLPCIIESQKTLDGKQLFKVADICQALVVGERVENDEDAAAGNTRAFNINDFIWPHGITPPLKHVRKRRFRKRISRAAIEIVEQEIERLLEMDGLAQQVEYKILENVNPDLSDGEFDLDHKLKGGSPDEESYFDGAATPDLGAGTPFGGNMDDGLEGDEKEGEAEDDDGSEDDLAAELERALAGEEESGEDEDEDEDDDDETEEDTDEDEDAELTQAKRLLNEEIHDLEAAVEKKINEIASSGNPLIKRRFEDALKKLKADLDAKRGQMEALTSKPQDEDGMEVDGADDDMDDLFADDDDEEEEEEVPAAEAPKSPEPENPIAPVVIQLQSS